MAFHNSIPRFKGWMIGYAEGFVCVIGNSGATSEPRVQKLLKLGVPEQYALMAGSSSKSYWRSSKTYAINAGMSNAWLEKQGVPNVKALWCKAQGWETKDYAFAP